jgi:hypothetical protein
MCNHRRVVFFISCLLWIATAQGQTYIFGRADLTVGPGAFSAATGDFNGDGIVDIVSANQGNNTVSVRLGNLNGGFNSQVAYATGTAPTAVVTGDFNNDGNLDLAVSNGNCVIEVLPNALTELNCSAATVSILLGNGDGTFQPHLDYAVGKNPTSLAAADFNGDGNTDLAVLNSNDGTVSVLLGHGDGSFQPQVIYKVPDAQSLLIGDFNNDHKPDLALLADGVSVLLGNGDGTFQSALNYMPNVAPLSGPVLAAADFNLDGKLDLFAGGDVLLGNGDGTFVLHATYGANGSGGSPAAAGDLNGDGKPDLVIGTSVFLGNGDGTFQAAVPYAQEPYDSDTLLTDLNGDGKLDLAVVESGCTAYGCSTTPSATIAVLLGLGDGTFGTGKDYFLQSASSPAVSTSAYQVVSGDFNGDGKPDLAAAGTSGPNNTTTPLGVFLGNGDGTLQPEVPTILNLAAGPIATADFNADGKADLATVLSNCTNNTCVPGEAVVLIGNGDGTFQSPVENTVGLQPQNLAVGDFNGDTKPDLAVSNYASNTVSILLGNGNGTFQPHVDYGGVTGTIVTGDFNGDGKLDLAGVSRNGVALLLGNGDGTFQAAVTYTMNASSLVAADFNGDKKLDLAMISGSSAQVLVLLGNGDGTFQAPIASGTGSAGGPYLSSGDFNGDGKPDLILAPSYSGISVILLGNGDGTFGPPISNLLATGPIALADLNLDGQTDIAGGTGLLATTNGISLILSGAYKAISPAALNFGSQGVGTTSAAQTITIGNPSNVSINVASIAANGDFGQSNDCGASLAPAAHCAIPVSFTPTTTGSQTGTIAVTDSTRISPLAISLSGSGVNGPVLTADPGRTNFTPQAVGTSSTPAAVMLVNAGNAGLNISGISIAGTDSSDFSQKNNCGASLAAGAGCTVNVIFAPTASGSRTASIAISGTEPGSPLAVELSGTALGPALGLSPAMLSFASETVGIASAAQVVTLTNTGNEPQKITGISATGDFAETNTCGASLANGSSCQISVTFMPSAAGSRTGTVAIGGSAQTIALSGVGVAVPDFTVGLASGSPGSQTVTAGTNAQFSVALAPAGSFTGTVALTCSITPAATPAPTCSLSSSSVQLTGSGETVTVTVASTAPVTTASNHVASLAWTALLLGIGWLFPRKRRWLVVSVSAMVLVFGSALGCGGGGGGSSTPSHPTTTPGTPAGTYTATLAATSGSLSHTTTMTVVVQ